MPSERITIHRTNVDKTEVIEQYPKTIASQVYDFESEKFLDATLEDIKEKIEQSKLDDIVISVKNFGAKGNFNTTTLIGDDDTDSIQRAFDYLYEKGGGTLYFPLGIYRVTRPIIIKTVAPTGGYSYPKITLQGEGNLQSQILKTGTDSTFNIDAACIIIKGSTMNLEDAYSGVGFENVCITNNSPGNRTYGVYGRRGSRIVANYSTFRTQRELETINSHDRYAFFVGTGWANSFRDCTFIGDYGIFFDNSSTSLLLENIFVGTDKIGYNLAGTYSSLVNVFGDFCNGILFNFNFATVDITALGGESPDCHTMIRCNNSNVSIGQSFFIQPTADDATIIYTNGSKVNINSMVVNMQPTSRGYLWNGGTSNVLKIDSFKFNVSDRRFKYAPIDTMASNLNSVTILPNETTIGKSIVPLLNYGRNYWDWYLETPQYPINNIILGLNTPTTASNGDDVQYASSGVLNAFYLNGDPLNRKVLGWVRDSQTNGVLRNGTNKYVPLILSGNTSQRPEWKTLGMNYFDTTLNKPIWWNGTVWVDSSGTTV